MAGAVVVAGGTVPAVAESWRCPITNGCPIVCAAVGSVTWTRSALTLMPPAPSVACSTKTSVPMPGTSTLLPGDGGDRLAVHHDAAHRRAGDGRGGGVRARAAGGGVADLGNRDAAVQEGEAAGHDAPLRPAGEPRDGHGHVDLDAADGAAAGGPQAAHLRGSLGRAVAWRRSPRPGCRRAAGRRSRRPARSPDLLTAPTRPIPRGEQPPPDRRPQAREGASRPHCCGTHGRHQRSPAEVTRFLGKGGDSCAFQRKGGSVPASHGVECPSPVHAQRAGESPSETPASPHRPRFPGHRVRCAPRVRSGDRDHRTGGDRGEARRGRPYPGRARRDQHPGRGCR